MNEIVKTDEVLSAAQNYLSTVNGLSEKETTQFLEIAKAFHLNPFKREIYVVAYGEGQYRTCSIITGYEVYLKRAERTGKLDGWSCDITEDGKKATCTVFRKDWRNPLVHSVYFSEAAQYKKNRDGTQSLNSMWQKMPKFMLRKVAIGQAFRLAFPDELGGMPYLAEEITGDRYEDLPTAEVIESATESSEAKPENLNEKQKEVERLQSEIQMLAKEANFDMDLFTADTAGIKDLTKLVACVNAIKSKKPETFAKYQIKREEREYGAEDY